MLRQITSLTSSCKLISDHKWESTNFGHCQSPISFQGREWQEGLTPVNCQEVFCNRGANTHLPGRPQDQEWQEWLGAKSLNWLRLCWDSTGWSYHHWLLDSLLPSDSSRSNFFSGWAFAPSETDFRQIHFSFTTNQILFSFFLHTAKCAQQNRPPKITVFILISERHLYFHNLLTFHKW